MQTSDKVATLGVAFMSFPIRTNVTRNRVKLFRKKKYIDQRNACNLERTGNVTPCRWVGPGVPGIKPTTINYGLVCLIGGRVSCNSDRTQTPREAEGEFRILILGLLVCTVTRPLS